MFPVFAPQRTGNPDLDRIQDELARILKDWSQTLNAEPLIGAEIISGRPYTAGVETVVRHSLKRPPRGFVSLNGLPLRKMAVQDNPADRLNLMVQPRECIERKSVTTALTSLSFDVGVSGAADEGYEIIGVWKKAVGGVVFVTVEPGGVSSNQETTRINNDNGGAPSAGVTTDLVLAALGSTYAAGAQAVVHGQLGAKVDDIRPWKSHHGAADATIDSSLTLYGGGWNEASPADFTSLDIVADTANAIDAGSWFELWRSVPGQGSLDLLVF